MDEIDLGDLDDEARAAARTRRKAINARVEGELEPAVQTPSHICEPVHRPLCMARTSQLM